MSNLLDELRNRYRDGNEYIECHYNINVNRIYNYFLNEITLAANSKRNYTMVNVFNIRRHFSEKSGAGHKAIQQLRDKGLKVTFDDGVRYVDYKLHQLNPTVEISFDL